MNLLYRYSQQYWKLFVVALLLAATNQIFSLLDPLIFRHVIDSYATKYHQYTQAQFVRGAGLLLLAAVGVAFVSRVAKNFQDYFVNVIVQRLGAKMYSDGIRQGRPSDGHAGTRSACAAKCANHNCLKKAVMAAAAFACWHANRSSVSGGSVADDGR